MSIIDAISSAKTLMVHQRVENAELFGFETRNKYSIETSDGAQVGFAAEQGKGFGAFMARQFLGHWRGFEIFLYETNRELAAKAVHPFRFYFHRLEIADPSGSLIGVIEKRFSITRKAFDILDQHGQVVMSVASPLWKIWTFPFMRQDQEVAVVSKKWSGLIKEGFTDADTFKIDFLSPDLKAGDKLLVVMASLYIDLMYFEGKAGTN